MRSLLDAIRPPTYAGANGMVRKPLLTPARLTGLANLCGASLISYGVGMIFVPAGLIVGGVLVVLLGKAMSLPSFPSVR
jgi:hypothetical protein